MHFLYVLIPLFSITDSIFSSIAILCFTFHQVPPLMTSSRWHSNYDEQRIATFDSLLTHYNMFTMYYKYKSVTIKGLDVFHSCYESWFSFMVKNQMSITGCPSFENWWILYWLCQMPTLDTHFWLEIKHCHGWICWSITCLASTRICDLKSSIVTVQHVGQSLFWLQHAFVV